MIFIRVIVNIHQSNTFVQVFNNDTSLVKFYKAAWPFSWKFAMPRPSNPTSVTVLVDIRVEMTFGSFRSITTSTGATYICEQIRWARAQIM